ncbi:Protein spinster 2 [Thelohanellus kitauei]|uniref:Protein spinster 2 n=1 Tax=Thelohanellus kitauei TaxID=669202 RepID=A0A0C2M243_THEKT|nr:Protein spinster 2 [Thelohanellus kitauei]
MISGNRKEKALLEDRSIKYHKMSRSTNVLVFLLVVSNIFNYMDRMLVSAILSKVTDYFAINNVQAGLLQTTFLISLMFSGLLYGILGDIFDRRYLIASGMLIWSAAELLGSFVPEKGKGAFFATRIFFGIGQAALTSLGVPIISSYCSGRKRTICNTLFIAMIPIGR